MFYKTGKLSHYGNKELELKLQGVWGMIVPTENQTQN